MIQQVRALITVLTADIAFAWRTVIESCAAMIERRNTYHPEAHYMRGPGPRWREKHISGRVTR
jgi:hypothetical protein